MSDSITKHNLRLLTSRLRKGIVMARHDQSRADSKVRRLRKKLGKAIAREKGLVVGRSYYVMPVPGKKFRAEVRAVGEAWGVGLTTVSVLIYYYNRNGAFRSEWVDAGRHEFLPIPQSETSNPKSTKAVPA